MPRANNSTGRNQYGEKLRADDSKLKAALERLHREGVTSNTVISQRLQVEDGIDMSPSTVKRRRAELGFHGSRKTVKKMSYTEAEQMVLDQLEQESNPRHGPRTIKARIAYDRGVHISRDVVRQIMHNHDPEGFAHRGPTARKTTLNPKHAVGIHERWTADSHDKLSEIGFRTWVVIDNTTSKWLDAWVVPSNRSPNTIVSYLFLCLAEKHRGIPLQFMAGHSSESTSLCGLVDALRSTLRSDTNLEESPINVYLRNVQNVTVDQSCLRLRLEFGDDMADVYQRGIKDGVFNPNDFRQNQLFQWLFSILLRKELRRLMDVRNAARLRKDKNKPGPSDISRNEAFSLPDKWGGKNWLAPVNVEVIRKIKADMGGDELLEFVPVYLRERCQAVYDGLPLTELTANSLWIVFAMMYPLVYA